MAKWSGVIGYAEDVEVRPGVHGPGIIERKYFGDVGRNVRRLQGGSSVNDGITVSNEVSVVSDPYAIQNFHKMRYLSYMGENWRIESAEVQYPRIILTLGGVWNGDTAGTSSETPSET